MKKLSETYKELGIDFSFPIEIRNSNGKGTYFEDIYGYYEKWEYDANGKETYYENSYGRKRGTPRSQPSETLATNYEMAELKGQLSELRQMLSELHEVNAELHKDKQRLDWIQFTDLTLHHWEEGDLWSRNGVYTIREFIDKEM